MKSLAREFDIPVADCNTICNLELSKGKYYGDILESNVNHPGAYGHQLYYYSLKSLFTPFFETDDDIAALKTAGGEDNLIVASLLA